jgi:sporulation protein YlmC with PRC-barrel domain
MEVKMSTIPKNSLHRPIPCALAAAAIALAGVAGVHGPAYAKGQPISSALQPISSTAQDTSSPKQDKVAPPGAASTPMEREGAPITRDNGREDSGFTTAKEMLGKTAEAEAGGELGEVHDVILSADNKPTMVIITSGGFLGIGSKEVALPWKSVNYDPAQKVVLVSAINKDQFKRLGAYKSLDSVNTLRKVLAQNAREKIQMNRDTERAPATNRSPSPSQ